MSRGSLLAYLAIAITLLLVTIVAGEVYYLFFYQPAPKSTRAPQTMLSTTVTPSPTSATQNQTINQNAQDTLNRQQLLIDNATSYILSSQYEGEIVEIDTRGGAEKQLHNFEWKVKLRIKTKRKDSIPFLFNENDLRKIESVQIVNGKEVSINITSLEVGNSVILKQVWDMKKDPIDNIIEGKISKI